MANTDNKQLGNFESMVHLDGEEVRVLKRREQTETVWAMRGRAQQQRKSVGEVKEGMTRGRE
jgi:hypothetical protein